MCVTQVYGVGMYVDALGSKMALSKYKKHRGTAGPPKGFFEAREVVASPARPPCAQGARPGSAREVHKEGRSTCGVVDTGSTLKFIRKADLPVLRHFIIRGHMQIDEATRLIVLPVP